MAGNKNDIDSYVVWTNKGGVGKTTMSFQIAMEYARNNPKRRVLMIDMCPQANLSATALTHLVMRAKKNKPEAVWLHRGEPLVNRLMGTAFVPTSGIVGDEFIPRTIAGFLTSALEPDSLSNNDKPPVDWYAMNVQKAIRKYCRESDGEGCKACRAAHRGRKRKASGSDEPEESVVHCDDCVARSHGLPFEQEAQQPLPAVGTYHGIDELRPDNLYLVCGDPNLEDIVGELHTSSSHNDKSFSRVHNYLKTFIEVLKARPGWDKQGLTVFIDTNPALTMYTRLALCAARKLVMVVMADDFSREALRSSGLRVYDLHDETGPGHVINRFGTRSLKNWAQKKKLKPDGTEEPLIKLPKMHVMIANRTKTVGIATPGAKKDKKDKNAAKAEKDAVKEVKAFLVMAEHCADTLYSFYEKRHKDFQTRKHPLPEKESNGPVPKKQFKDGWGDDDAQKARTRYVVPMCDMNQSAVLANHFGLGFHAFVSGGRFEPAIRKAVKDFLKGSGSIPTAQANKNVFKYLQNVVVAITESA